MPNREVTIEPADNGFIVRHYQESTKKDEPGQTIRRVASTRDEALRHAGSVLGGGKTKVEKKRESSAEAASEAATGSGGGSSAPRGRSSARRRRPRSAGRR